MNHGGRVSVPGGTAKMEIAFHSSSLPDGSYGGNPAGWLLDVAGKRIYVAGDTAVFGDMERIGRPRDGRGLDLAILPIGDLFTMGPEESLAADRAEGRGLGRTRAGGRAFPAAGARARGLVHAGLTATSMPPSRTRTGKTLTFSFSLSHQAPSQTRNRQACHGQVTTPSTNGPEASEAPMWGQRSSIAW
jgi:hypothetical protein